MRARSLRLLAVIGLLGLLGCVSAPAGRHHSIVAKGGDTPGAAIARRWAAPAGWHLLYSRPGFTGAATVDLRVVGDIMLARGVEPLIRRQPPGWLFGATAGLLRGDIVAGNLESPFATARRPDRLRPGPYRLAADPALADRLAPFTALSLANNHALDAGVEGLADAERVLRAAGIAPLGIRGGSCLADPAATPAAGDQAHLLAYKLFPIPRIARTRCRDVAGPGSTIRHSMRWRRSRYRRASRLLCSCIGVASTSPSPMRNSAPGPGGSSRRAPI